MTQMMLTKELAGKRVMTPTGKVIGILDDIVIDTATGEIRYILVRSSDAQANPGQRIDGKGRLVYSTTRISIDDAGITLE